MEEGELKNVSQRTARGPADCGATFPRGRPRRGRGPPYRRHRDSPAAFAPADARAARAAQRRPRRVGRRNCPCARSSARLSDAARPSCSSLRSTTSRGSSEPGEELGVSSVDASSTTISSRSPSVWPQHALDGAAARKRASSCVARRTETSGTGVSVRPWRPSSFPHSTSSSPPSTASRARAAARLAGAPDAPGFRLLLVDQNDDDRLDPCWNTARLEMTSCLRGEGLSRARNAAWPLAAELVAFPDDDCAYPDDLLERVARRFAGDPSWTA